MPSTYMTTPGREELDERELLLRDEILEVGVGSHDDIAGVRSSDDADQEGEGGEHNEATHDDSQI